MRHATTVVIRCEVTLYSPPLREIRFALEHIADLPAIASTTRFADVDVHALQDVLAGVGRLMSEVIAPTNRDGDVVGARWNADGAVLTPDSFKVAYAAWVESGFGSMPFDPEFGGAGVPWLIAIAAQEMFASANMALSLCPVLSQGAIDAIAAHGSDEQRARYLPKLVSGEWTGTMNLTEPQAGSDVGAVSTKAVADPAASEHWGHDAYAINGQKIFITWGEHDLAEQIVHLVLARTPGSPMGTSGLSMFLVPKWLENAEGTARERNAVQCLSVEHKLGIHGSPTCVMSFENATGWLIGEERSGMRNMFTMMNNARLSIGLEGVAIAERAYQQAVHFANERVQGRAAGSASAGSSPIIEHPDVRRMLMTQRAWIDALRGLAYATAASVDRLTAATNDAEAARWRDRRDVLIPLTKSLCTDVANEVTSLALQIHGGAGYIEETGVAQHYRDARIAAIYEGTNGIQAADLVGRKLQIRGGAAITELLDECEAQVQSVAGADGMAQFAASALAAIEASRHATSHLLELARTDRRGVLAGSTPYLRLLASTVCAGLLAKALPAASATSDPFGTVRVTATRFFGEQILPQSTSLLPAVLAGARDLDALGSDQFGPF